MSDEPIRTLVNSIQHVYDESSDDDAHGDWHPSTFSAVVPMVRPVLEVQDSQSVDDTVGMRKDTKQEAGMEENAAKQEAPAPTVFLEIVDVENDTGACNDGVATSPALLTTLHCPGGRMDIWHCPSSVGWLCACRLA
eukprot:TRINITY_DN61318_c0_g1_i1.p2 TRINITY_DN61318_c0_g1~~TRINITY_DN61318_c0_g1_i1.p2  ORF type:complete len:137 (-),score=5.13 TRINITY_DN61318_c0_g1_i1:158-568(-)